MTAAGGIRLSETLATTQKLAITNPKKGFSLKNEDELIVNLNNAQEENATIKKSDAPTA